MGTRCEGRTVLLVHLLRLLHGVDAEDVAALHEETDHLLPALDLRRGKGEGREWDGVGTGEREQEVLVERSTRARRADALYIYVDMTLAPARLRGEGATVAERSGGRDAQFPGRGLEGALGPRRAGPGPARRLRQRRARLTLRARRRPGR